LGDVTSSIALAMAISWLLPLAAGLVWVVRGLSKKIDRMEPVLHSAPTDKTSLDLHIRIDDLQTEIDKLTIGVSEGIAGYQRHEKRIQKTVTSAKRLLAENGLEHAALDAENDELPERNAPSSEEEPLQLVPEDLEPARPTGVPGVGREELDRIILARAERS